MRDGVTRSDECRLFAFVQDDEPKYGGRYGHDDRYDHDGRGARLPLLYALVPSEQQRQGQGHEAPEEGALVAAVMRTTEAQLDWSQPVRSCTLASHCWQQTASGGWRVARRIRSRGSRRR